MDKKLIVFDIDGTILPKNKKKVNEKTIAAIKKVQQLGHIVSIASGRNANALYAIAKSLNLADGKTPIVGLNGAEVFLISPEQEVTYLWERAFNRELSQDIIQQAWNNRVDFFAYTNNTKVHYVGRILAIFSIAMSVARRARLVKVKKDFSNLNYDVTKFLIYGRQKRIQAFLKGIESHNFSIVKWSEATDPKSNIEVNMPGISKVVGLEEMAKILKIDQKDVIFFGDGDNDISALKWAGIGVAMGNAQPGVAEHANEQTLSVFDDGVAHWLQKNIIEKEA